MQRQARGSDGSRRRILTFLCAFAAVFAGLALLHGPGPSYSKAHAALGNVLLESVHLASGVRLHFEAPDAEDIKRRRRSMNNRKMPHLVAEEFKHGRFSAFHHGMTYAGTGLTAARAAFSWAWDLFSSVSGAVGGADSRLAGHLAFSYGVDPMLLAFAASAATSKAAPSQPAYLPATRPNSGNKRPVSRPTPL